MEEESTERENRLTRRQAAVDVVLTIVLVPATALAAATSVGLLSPGAANLTATITVQALLALAGVKALLRWRSQQWREIWLHPPQGRDAGRGLLVLLTGFALNAALTGVMVALSPETLETHIAGLRSLAQNLMEHTPLPVALALLLLVGIYEEVVARGLLLSRAVRLLGGFWLPVSFSAALFALGHFYQGVYGMVQTALFGAVLAAFTLRWGTLWPAILAHAAFNSLSIVQLGQESPPV